MRKTGKKYNCVYFCLFLRLQKRINSCNSCFISIHGIHSLCPVPAVPCCSTFHFLKCFSPLSPLCIISLCCIIVTVLNRYSNILRADLFLWISLLMFAELFYILAGKSSKKPFNLLIIQFNLSSSGQRSSVFNEKKTKKKDEMTPDMTDQDLL